MRFSPESIHAEGSGFVTSRSPRAILRNVTRLVTGVALVGFCGMLLSTWAQILFRKLAISVDWTEELARILFITSVFLGIAIGVAENATSSSIFS